jgi:photosystem II stability/assembly factor-like uncharacterized protein
MCPYRTTLTIVAFTVQGLFCLLGGNRSLNAQPALSFGEASFPAHGDAALRDVAFTDLDRGWAVGDRGMVWRTEDGGKHWFVQQLATTADLTDVFFLDQQFGWIAGGERKPLTHRSQGVLFRTVDGGKTWRPTPANMLPGIRSIRFFSPHVGVACGERSWFFPNGQTKTKDGGLGWSVSGPGSGPHIVTAEIVKPNTTLSAGRDGWVAVTKSGRTKQSQTPAIGDRTIRDIQMVDELNGWLVGDGGLVLSTSNGGRSWQGLTQIPSCGLLDGIDWYSVATEGNHVWVVGAPGSVVLYSPDAGRSWKLLPTGQSLPLYAITFPTAQFGVASGALGTILTTDNGGRTWTIARREVERVALLVFSAERNDIVWEIPARYSAGEGWVAVLDTVFRRDVEIRQLHSPAIPDLLQAAMLAADGSDSHRAWQFPLRQQGINPPPAEIFEAWKYLHRGDPRERLLDYLVRQIRMWRPTVIVAPAGTAQGPQAMLIGALEAAVQRAAATDEHDGQIQQAHLSPWKVTRLVLADDKNTKTELGFHTARLSSRLGESVSSTAAKARLFIEKHYRSSPHRIGIRTLVDDAATGERNPDLFGGLTTTANSTMKRKLPSPSTNLQQLSQTASRIRNVERVLAHLVSGESSVNVAQLSQMTRGLPAEAKVAVLLQMEATFRQTGDRELADDALKRIIREYRGTPHAEWANIKLIRGLASGELGWSDKGQTVLQRGAMVRNAGFATDNWLLKTDSTKAANDGTRTVVQAGGGLDRTGPAVQLATNTVSLLPDLSKRRRLAFRFGEQLLQHRLDLIADPSVGFPLAAAHRLEGEVEQAAGFHRLFVSRHMDGPWAKAAREELWTYQQRGRPPLKRTRSPWANSPPVLDGKLAEPTWELAEELQLHSADPADENWASSVKIAHDDVYLYLAARCRKTVADRYPTDPETRRRTSDLSSWDRVRICIDIDRDFSSYIELAVDCRGWVLDNMRDNPHWNPRWYVYDWRTEDEWGFEAAIPWDEFAPPEQRAIASINIARVAPRTGVQSWTGGPSVTPRVDGFGTVTFSSETAELR